jgi:hypothetical protein
MSTADPGFRTWVGRPITRATRSLPFGYTNAIRPTWRRRRVVLHKVAEILVRWWGGSERSPELTAHWLCKSACNNARLVATPEDRPAGVELCGPCFGHPS